MLGKWWQWLWNQFAMLTAPGIRHYVIVPDDNADLPIRPRAILLLDDNGTVMLRDEYGVDVPYIIKDGTRLDFSPKRVLSTGTTVKAGSLIAWC
jgi:hypothetical protein